jgi:hypothetical protein
LIGTVPPLLNEADMCLLCPFVHRNITITGLPGLDPVPQLDLQYKTAVAQLCDNCWAALLNITVKDERLVRKRPLASNIVRTVAGAAATGAAAAALVEVGG